MDSFLHQYSGVTIFILWRREIACGLLPVQLQISVHIKIMFPSWKILLWICTYTRVGPFPISSYQQYNNGTAMGLKWPFGCIYLYVIFVHKLRINEVARLAPSQKGWVPSCRSVGYIDILLSHKMWGNHVITPGREGVDIKSIDPPLKTLPLPMWQRR